MKSSRLPLVISVAFFALFLLPILFLLYAASWVGDFRFTPDLIFSRSTIQALETTLIFAAVATIVQTALNAPYAWLVNRTNVPYSGALQTIVILGLTMPAFVKAISWTLLGDPDYGLINVLFKRVFGYPIIDIYTVGALAFVFAVSGAPVMQLMLNSAFQAMDPAQEEASRVAGRSLFKTFLMISLPTLLPALLAVIVLEINAAMTNFDYPTVFSQYGHFNTLSTLVDDLVGLSLRPNYGAAATIGIIFAVITIGPYALYLYKTKDLFRFVTLTGKPSQQSKHNLGKWKWPAFAYCLGVFALSFILPIMALLWSAFTPYTGSMTISFSLRNFIGAVNMPYFWQSLQNSTVLGVLMVALGVPMTTLMAYGALRTGRRGARLIEFIAVVPVSFPGIVFGLAVFFMFILAPGINILYGTIWPMVIASIVFVLPVVFRSVSGRMVQIGPELEEASRVCGEGWPRTFTGIVLPLLRSALINSVIVFFVDAVRELGPIVLLSTPQFFLYLFLLFDAYSSNVVTPNVVSAASLMVVALLAAFIVSAKVIQRYGPGGGQSHAI